jgi:hypothetical protein
VVTCGHVLRDGPLAYLCIGQAMHAGPHGDGLGYAWPVRTNEPAPVLAAPVSISPMQVAPGAWTVELACRGVRRFASVGLRSRRRAMESVTEWLEMDGGSL